MEENYPQEPQHSLFDDQLQYEDASQRSRFVNFIVDSLFMRFVLSYATGYILGFLLAYIAPDFLMSIAYEERGIHFWLLTLILGYFNYLVYYTFCETAFKGYTLGKLISGTRAVYNDGSNLLFKDALLRSLSRIVPFEAFSTLGNAPWHDTWTNTTVIKTR